uniref:Neurotransmitter-gated ion-channel ligand-binding domain-containing protein n=1 Tax=Pinguiococcus pyrenoidosus TaxID=172671 RepID=A0A7R9U1D8_9STRA|mmetsp:Transcript_11106/g.41480  ORF Transcript_11106/g.41480 Transcript_11106/m.41480 type:complete len:545 (+) Transcript_11106:175-1809(+)
MDGDIALSHIFSAGAEDVFDDVHFAADEQGAHETNGGLSLFERALDTKKRRSLPAVMGFKPIVFVGFKIQHIGRIDHVHGEFQVRFKVFFRWTDPTIKGKFSNGDVLHGEDLGFNPALDVANEIFLKKKGGRIRVVDSAEGSVKQSWEYLGSIALKERVNCVVDHPFDFHNLHIIIKPQKLTTDDIELLPNEYERAVEAQREDEWNIIGALMQTYETAPSASSTSKVYPTIHIVILVERQSHWYLWNVFAPMCGCVILSWFIFLFGGTDGGDVDLLPARFEICVGLLLGIIATKFVVSNNIPKTPVQTLCDSYILVCYTAVLGCGIGVGLVGLVDVYFGQDPAYFLNVVWALSCIGLFLLAQLIFYLRYAQNRNFRNQWVDRAIIEEAVFVNEDYLTASPGAKLARTGSGFMERTSRAQRLMSFGHEGLVRKIVAANWKSDPAMHEFSRQFSDDPSEQQGGLTPVCENSEDDVLQDGSSRTRRKASSKGGSSMAPMGQQTAEMQALGMTLTDHRSRRELLRKTESLPLPGQAEDVKDSRQIEKS